MNISELKPGDKVKMKKAHPCGENCWEIIRVGMDFKVQCCGCGKYIRFKRKKFEKYMVKVLEKAD